MRTSIKKCQFACIGDLGPDTQAHMAFFTRKKRTLFHSEPYTRLTSETAQAAEPGSQDGSEPFSLTPPCPSLIQIVSHDRGKEQQDS